MIFGFANSFHKTPPQSGRQRPVVADTIRRVATVSLTSSFKLMTPDTYPRLSNTALQILAACTEEFRTSQDIAADAGMAGTGLTAWVGAYDREARAKWRGTGR